MTEGRVTAETMARRVLDQHGEPYGEEDVARLTNTIRRLSAEDARYTAGAGAGQVVHHINGDPLDNDVRNLVIVDPSENAGRAR